jgi:transcriptional regulator GlxA family with amidase domain
VSELAVVFVAFDGVQLLDVAGPHEVFTNAGDAAESLGRRAEYRVRVASAHGGLIRTERGLELGTVPLPGLGERIDTLLLPGGTGSRAASADPDLIAFVRAAASGCRRVVAVCTGAFIAAAAGLLDGRRVTTHWAAAQELQAEYPSLEVDPDPLYIRDGQVWTSAGVTAGIDLALALVADDMGTDVAQTLARWMVMFLHRPGGQTQFATPVWVRSR